jgi:replicative DNA helicase
MNTDTFFQDERHERWMQITKELYRRVYAEDAPEAIHDWLVEVIKKMAPDAAGGLSTSWPQSFEIYDKEIMRRVEMSKLPEAERNMFKWPWSSWNNVIDPAEGGMLVLLAGPDGAGKTTYAECIGEHWARRGQRIVFVHFELSKIIMFDRRAVRHTSIARSRLKLAGDLSDADMNKLKEAKKRLLDWPGEITYLHTPGKTIELVLRELDKCRCDNLCDAIIIDYIEKAAASSAQLKEFGSNVFAREASDVELLKSWSENNGIPALVLSQFNKAGKHSGFGDLDRTMIRGAGEKTEKANVVVMLQPDKNKPGIINVLIDKNTMGAKGKFQQFFDGANFSVGDIVNGN